MSWLNEPSPPTIDLVNRSVTRVELIDHRSSSDKPGRVFQAHDVETALLSFQDDGQTLKVFIS
jgi:hypothetical protein